MASRPTNRLGSSTSINTMGDTSGGMIGPTTGGTTRSGGEGWLLRVWWNRGNVSLICSVPSLFLVASLFCVLQT